jgi:hypothetical protein
VSTAQGKWDILALSITYRINWYHIYHLVTADFNRRAAKTTNHIYLLFKNITSRCGCFEKKIDVGQWVALDSAR